jgi:hypothetical protein
MAIIVKGQYNGKKKKEWRHHLIYSISFIEGAGVFFFVVKGFGLHK